MKAFPPGFPFVSRTPEPAPEPEPAAAPEPVAEAASEPAPAPHPEPDPQAFHWRKPVAAPEPEPNTEPAAEREPWPFRKRTPMPAPAPKTVPAREPVVGETAVTMRIATAASQPAPVSRKIEPQIQPSTEALSPPPEKTVRAASTAAAPATPARPAVTHERRKVKRDALATAALLRVDGVHGPPLKIELTDISIAGARFRAPHKLDVGEKAQIRVEVGPFRWTTRLRVVHCSPTGDGATTIGCAFLRTELLRPWPAAA